MSTILDAIASAVAGIFCCMVEIFWCTVAVTCVAVMVTVGYLTAVDPPPSESPRFTNVAINEEATWPDRALGAVALRVMRWEVRHYGPVSTARGTWLDGTEVHMVGVAGKWYLW